MFDVVKLAFFDYINNVITFFVFIVPYTSTIAITYVFPFSHVVTKILLRSIPLPVNIAITPN